MKVIFEGTSQLNNNKNNTSMGERNMIRQKHDLSLSTATEFIRTRNISKRHSLQLYPNKLSINSIMALKRAGRVKNFGDLSMPIIIGPKSPIRHLICSPGLEFKDNKRNIIVLYKGSCSTYCNDKNNLKQKVHVHYIVNTVNCNDHISRIVKKLGLEFFNSFVLQSQDSQAQVISTYNMEKVKVL